MAAAKQPSTLEILNMAIANKPKPKSGLSKMWGGITDAIGDTASGISVLASTGVELATQAKASAIQGKVESYKELLETFGIEAEGAEAIVLAQKLMLVLQEQ